MELVLHAVENFEISSKFFLKLFHAKDLKIVNDPNVLDTYLIEMRVDNRATIIGGRLVPYYKYLEGKIFLDRIVIYVFEPAEFINFDTVVNDMLAPFIASKLFNEITNLSTHESFKLEGSESADVTAKVWRSLESSRSFVNKVADEFEDIKDIDELAPKFDKETTLFQKVFAFSFVLQRMRDSKSIDKKKNEEFLNGLMPEIEKLNDNEIVYLAYKILVGYKGTFLFILDAVRKEFLMKFAGELVLKAHLANLKNPYSTELLDVISLAYLHAMVGKNTAFSNPYLEKIVEFYRAKSSLFAAEIFGQYEGEAKGDYYKAITDFYREIAVWRKARALYQTLIPNNYSITFSYENSYAPHMFKQLDWISRIKIAPQHFFHFRNPFALIMVMVSAFIVFVMSVYPLSINSFYRSNDVTVYNNADFSDLFTFVVFNTFIWAIVWSVGVLLNYSISGVLADLLGYYHTALRSLTKAVSIFMTGIFIFAGIFLSLILIDINLGDEGVAGYTDKSIYVGFSETPLASLRGFSTRFCENQCLKITFEDAIGGEDSIRFLTGSIAENERACLFIEELDELFEENSVKLESAEKSRSLREDPKVAEYCKER